MGSSGTSRETTNVRFKLLGLIALSILGMAHGLHAQLTARDYNSLLGQGINLGNTLESPVEGAWGFVLEPWHFESIAYGGFDFVRVPIKFSGHAMDTAPYTIDASFFHRIDWVVEQARTNKLSVILDLHHYDELVAAPTSGHRQRYVELWRQIAERYQDQPQTVFFELLNEPNGAMNSVQWNGLLNDTLEVIRPTNPDRMVIIGPTNWNSAVSMSSLQLPANDQNIIGTFHFYSPFNFTHQGAEWVEGSDAWLGTTWTGTPFQQQTIRNEMQFASNWSDQTGRPVLMGEFGAYSRADMASRSTWTQFVRQEAENRGFSWAYWEFGAGFGAFDRETRLWIPELRNALSPFRTGDFNGDFAYDCGDLDLFASAMSSGQNLAWFDLNRDAILDRKDLQLWLLKSETLPGDANFDGVVDGSDFGIWNANKFSTSSRWCSGDFNLDGIVDGSDFGVWNANKFRAGLPRNSQVPEPIGWGIIVISIIFVLSRARS